MSDFYCTLTEVGAAKLAQAGMLGLPLAFAAVAIGDGNPSGEEPTPESVMLSERYRRAVNAVYSPPEDESVVIVEMEVPVDVGGFEVNEVSVIDDAGDTVAIANYPKTWKPVVQSGTGRTLLIRIMVDVGSADSVVLQIDPAMVMATRQYVDNSAEASRQYTDDLVAGIVRYYDVIPAQNVGSLIYVWPLGIMRWFGDWYRSVECGQIRLIGRPTPEPGTIKANGANVEKASAPGLWSWAQEAGVVVPLANWTAGTPFYAEVSATHFRVPDLRAEHLRAWDDARGVDAARAFGSWQDSAVKSHTHDASSAASGNHNHTASSAESGVHSHAANSAAAGVHNHTASSAESGVHNHTASSAPAGEHTHTVQEGASGPGGSGETLTSGDDFTNATAYLSNTSAAGSHSHAVTVDNGGSHSHAVTVDNGGSHSHAVTVDNAGSHSHAVTVDNAGSHSHAVTVEATGLVENRVRNTALLAVIHL